MAGPTTLVLLPGLDGTEIFFRPLLTVLPAAIRPVVVTLPMSGANDYVTLLRHVRGQIADIPDCIVLGWSFAGPLAIMLAATEPGKVRGLILAATFARPPLRLLPLLRPVLVAPVIWAWRFCRRLPLWLLRPPDDPLRRAKTETWTRIPARVLAARLRAISQVDVRATLRACPPPVLYLRSQSDFFVPPDNAAEIAQLRLDVRTVTIPGRHLALYSNPRAAATAITDFVAAVNGAPPGPGIPTRFAQGKISAPARAR
jgi:pimeloyl-ACP methyl ester carboxylesterase